MVVNVRHRETAIAVDEEGHRTYRSVYIVESDEEPLDVPDIPPAGSAYSLGDDYDPYAFSVEKPKVERIDGTHWKVTVTHTTRGTS